MHQPHRIALATALLLLSLSATPGRAAITLTGNWQSEPLAGPPWSGQDLLLPTTHLWLVGNGSLAATAGSRLQLATFSLGIGGTGQGVLDGLGTVMSLHGDGNSNRFMVGSTSVGDFTVSGGALLDGRADAAACQLGYRSCQNYIGSAAGSSGVFTVTGAGSEARFLHSFFVGGINVAGGYGTAGATTEAAVRVLDGGQLRTEGLAAGFSGWGPDANGAERSIATVLVQGPGSRWFVEADSVAGGAAVASFATGTGTATLGVHAGGRFEVVGSPGQGYGLLLGGGGSFSGAVTGANSVLAISGESHQGFLNLGADGGQADLIVSAGGRLVGGYSNNIGLNGGYGSLHVLGSGSQARFDAGALAVGHAALGELRVGDGGAVTARQLTMGGGRTGAGEVAIDGAGSVLRLGQIDGHRLIVADWGAAGLTVSGGALLDAAADAAACAGRWCGTIIGHGAGSDATFVVTDAGSEARFLGQMMVGATQRNTLAGDGWDFGTPGGITRAMVVVRSGGKLVNEWVDMGGWLPRAANSNEQSFADVVVSGAGSTWLIQGTAPGGNDANLAMGTQQRSTTTLLVSQGGQVQLLAPDTRSAGLYLSTGQGQSHVAVRGSGSRLDIQGVNANVSVGASGGGTATLVVQDGARLKQDGGSGSQLTVGEALSQGTMEISSGGQVSGARQVNVGSGGSGSLLITGAGSLLSTDRRGSFVGQLNVGSSGSGRLDVLDGGAASVFALQVGNGFDHAGSRGQAVIDGSGSRVTADAVDWHRLGLENGSVTVSGGGVLDAASNAAGCVGHWCGAFLANNAGGDVRLTVTGAGSRASFLSNFIAGGSYVTAPPGTPYSLGEPGAASQVLIEVLDGGVLTTEQASLGHGPQGPAALGTEAATVKVKLDGAGSRWTLTPNTQSGSNGATTLVTGLAGGTNTDVAIAVSGGARLELIAQVGQTANLQLARDGGTTALSVTGAGSELAMSGGTTRTLLIGRNQGQASVVLMDGARLSGASNVVVGLNQGSSAATGFLMLDGAQTSGQIAGDLALLRVGVGAWGNTQLTGGAQLGVVGSQGAIVTVGSYNSQAGAGMMMLDGPGTRLDVQTAGGGSAGSNASMTVGTAWGLMNIGNGAQLRLEGGLESTQDTPRLTTLTIGSSTTLGSGISAGQGFMTVRGSGSRVEVAGADPRVMIGMNGGLGIATLENGAVLATSYVGVGGNGGQGQLNLSAARVELAGQWTSQLLGPRLAVGFGSGSTGLVRLAAGTEVLLDGRGGPDRAALVLGGVTNTTLGSGRLLASGGSSITLLGAGSALFGQTGTGIGDFSGGSRLDLDGGTLFIGRYAGAVGELHLREASQALAGTVLVGASTVGVDSGQGWLHVTSGSALHADRLDIGSTSLLSGSGLIDVALVTNRGSINPGDSPGTLRFTGSFVNEAGGRLVLEVESDGHGGFVTDLLDFAPGASLQLGGAKIEFRFLGSTDPNAFQASGGFGLGSFLSQGGAPLDPALLAGASYSASSSAYQFNNFSFTPDGGAVFQAQPVPEPGTWGLLVLGLGLGGWLQRRRPRQT